MRNFKLLLGFGLLAGVLSSCATETIPADSDATPDGKYTINYGVQVVPVGDVDRGLNGATVTIQTQNGVTTKTVGADGIAVFENLNAGTISGYVSAPGFASINFKAFCAPTNVDVNTNGYVSSTVYILAKNASVAGRLCADTDQDGDNTLTDAGNFMAYDLMLKYTLGAYPMGTGDGMLTQVSLDYYTYTEATAATGIFVFDSLPNTSGGYFNVSMKTDPISLPNIAFPPYQIVYMYNFGAFQLSPGETLELGDILF